jgi:hypothetical protein
MRLKIVALCCRQDFAEVHWEGLWWCMLAVAALHGYGAAAGCGHHGAAWEPDIAVKTLQTLHLKA